MFRLLQSFPEWSELDSNLESATSIATKAIVEYDIQHGQKYSDFISRQPDSVKVTLQQIAECTKPERSFIDSHSSVLVKVRQELSKLKSFNERIKQDRKLAQAIYAQAEKSENYYCEQLAKLEQIRLKYGENSGEFQKQQDRVSSAESQKNRDAQLMQNKKQEMQPIEIEYKQKFIRCILDSLEMLSGARVETCQERSRIGANVEGLSDEISQPDDISLEKLNAELVQLDQMTVE